MKCLYAFEQYSQYSGFNGLVYAIYVHFHIIQYEQLPFRFYGWAIIPFHPYTNAELSWTGSIYDAKLSYQFYPLLFIKLLENLDD